MRYYTIPGLLALGLAPLPAAPAPAPVFTPAVVDAGCAANVPQFIDGALVWARFAVFRNQHIAELPVIRKQEDWQPWLKKSLRFERVKGGNLVRVSLTEGTPRERALIVYAVLTAYRRHVLEENRETLLRNVRMLEQTLNNKDPMFLRLVTPEQLALTAEHLRQARAELRQQPRVVEDAKAP